MSGINKTKRREQAPALPRAIKTAFLFVAVESGTNRTRRVAEGVDPYRVELKPPISP